ncbi:MAG: ATP-dependent sacrificial sulfur transferase LarE [Nitrospinae bacterium]|nr:ATP-dependent sacrificial sulfur transferase LarE [Nitrospinota bacterium]
MKPEGTEKKFSVLEGLLGSLGSVVVAYSGGVDSTLLVRAAIGALKENGAKILAVTARSSTYPSSEFDSAVETAALMGASHRVIVSEELNIPGFSDNPPERCYFCKGELFGILSKIARDEGYAAVCDGANMDDLGDYRPGRKAAVELGVRSPFIEAGMTKDDIRWHAHRLGLANWDKPATACLASRFPYGSRITAEKLSRVEKAEALLRGMGFGQLRVRDHDGVARVELARDQLGLLAGNAGLDEFVSALKGLGFSFVTLDLEGYRTGSLNALLSNDQRRISPEATRRDG